VRVTKQQLELQAQHINTVLKTDTYQIEYAYGSPRLIQLVGEHGGTRDVSPRMTKGQLYNWLDAFITGLHTNTKELHNG
jgi:hypothetical protein